MRQKTLPETFPEELCMRTDSVSSVIGRRSLSERGSKTDEDTNMIDNFNHLSTQNKKNKRHDEDIPQKESSVKPRIKKRRFSELEKIHQDIGSIRDFTDIMKCPAIRSCRMNINYAVNPKENCTANEKCNSVEDNYWRPKIADCFSLNSQNCDSTLLFITGEEAGEVEWEVVDSLASPYHIPNHPLNSEPQHTEADLQREEPSDIKCESVESISSQNQFQNEICAVGSQLQDIEANLQGEETSDVKCESVESISSSNQFLNEICAVLQHIEADLQGRRRYPKRNVPQPNYNEDEEE